MMIKGTQNPVVGTDEIYQYIDSLDIFNASNATFVWYIWKKKQGKWVDITSKPPKMGQKAPFKFGEKVIGEEFKLEVFKAIPIFGSDDFNAKSVGEIIVIPASSKIPKITKVELLYVDDTKGATFSFMEKLRAKANCVGLFGKELVFTLWEDDAEKSGHNSKNLFIDSKKGKVNSKGFSVVEFTLSKALMHKAMQGEADTKQLEFYVTVEYFKNNKHGTENVNVNNPFPKSQKPVATRQQAPAKAIGSPAANKPASKKEEKGIWDTFTESVSKKSGEMWDYAETQAKGIWDKLPTLSVPEGNSMNQVKIEANKQDPTNCICKEQYKDLIWGGKVNCEFRKKVVQICADLWGESRKMEMANGLMAVIYVETSGTFKAHQIMGKHLGDLNKITKDDFWLIKTEKNGKVISKTSRAVGLIQFTQSALQAMGEFKSGTGFDKLHEVKLSFAKMGEVKQLDKVKKYFEPSKNSIKSPEDIYLAVFAPKGVGKSDDYVLYEKGTVEYSQNASVDTKSTGLNKNDGNIQRSEILERYHDSFGKGENNRVKIFNCATTEKKRDKQDTGKWHDPLEICQRTKYNYSGGQNIEGGAFGKVRNSETKNHQGIDLFAIPGHTVYACVDGTVVEQRLSDSGGNLVTIQIKNKQDLLDRKTQINYQIQFDSKGDKGEQISAVNFSLEKDENLYLRYYHLSEVNVKKDDSVTSGEVIGKTGVTGNASGTKGPHLHFEILNTTAYPHGLSNRMNPAFFIKLQAINDKEQDRDCKFKYYKDGTKK